jgi:hypothetical protein
MNQRLFIKLLKLGKEVPITIYAYIIMHTRASRVSRLYHGVPHGRLVLSYRKNKFHQEQVHLKLNSLSACHWEYLRKKETKKQSDTLHVSIHIRITLRQTFNRADGECVSQGIKTGTWRTKKLIIHGIHNLQTTCSKTAASRTYIDSNRMN